VREAEDRRVRRLAGCREEALEESSRIVLLENRLHLRDARRSQVPDVRIPGDNPDPTSSSPIAKRHNFMGSRKALDVMW
jgi:hypothetical protein